MIRNTRTGLKGALMGLCLLAGLATAGLSVGCDEQNARGGQSSLTASDGKTLGSSLPINWCCRRPPQ